ncbi:ribonuclease T2 [Neorhizobium galegae]|uniref:ribonuclease T2 family protein n=1 Tax=Neorhizobium galegae TaxID=399 RepID=UPI001AE48378|nr:ribonuclease T2 [Neorhizobium galegae]
MVFRPVCALLVMLLAAIALPANAQDRPSGFDFYVLSLSWSPTYCGSAKDKTSQEQCGPDKAFGFIAHGLWPQNEKGYPETCATKEPRRVPEELGRAYFDIMPSMGLIGHEWRKHGSCSGLSQKAYLDTTRAAFERIRLPAEIVAADSAKTYSAEAIEESFIAANPGLRPEGIAVTCEASRLEEVRICLAKDLSFRTCPEVDAKACSLKRITVPPAR